MMSHDHNLLLKSFVFILIGKFVPSVDCLIAWQVQGNLCDMGVQSLCVGTYPNQHQLYLKGLMGISSSFSLVSPDEIRYYNYLPYHGLLANLMVTSGPSISPYLTPLLAIYSPTRSTRRRRKTWKIICTPNFSTLIISVSQSFLL